MRTLRRNLTHSVHVCTRQSTQNGIEVFSPAKRVQLHLEPVTDKTSIGISGENHEHYLKGIVTHTDRVGFDTHARVYVNVNPPINHDPLCRTADYIVDQQFDYLSHRIVVLRRLGGRV